MPANSNEKQSQHRNRRRRSTLAHQWRNQITENDFLTPTQKHVLLVISKYFDNDTLEYFPSMRAIAKRAKVSKSTVDTAIRNARELRLLCVDPNKNTHKKTKREHNQLNYYRGLFLKEPV